MSNLLMEEVDRSLVLGEWCSLEVGRRGKHRLLLCVEHFVALRGQGAFVAGWLLDPSEELESVGVQIPGSSEPIALSQTLPRPDLAALSELGKSAARLAAKTRPGFWHFFPADVDAEAREGRLLIETKSRGVAPLSLSLSAEPEDLLEFTRASGWLAVAPHLPRSPDALPQEWRDALFRLLWLMPERSEELAGLRAYVEAGEPLPAPGERENGLEGGDVGLALPGAQLAPHGAIDSRAVIEDIQASDLFDEEHYLTTYPDVGGAEVSPLEHYCGEGWREGRAPNAYFDTAWYRKTYLDVREADLNPLWHYAMIGEGNGRRPCAFFDPSYYARAYLGTDDPRGALADYLEHVRKGDFRNPVELFDCDYYLTHHPDVAQAGLDPVLHYTERGHAENRNPSPRFHTAYYRTKHLHGRLGVNPLAHYYDVGAQLELTTEPGPGDAEEEVGLQIQRWTRPGDAFEEIDPGIAAGRPPRAKLLAFYLPQFHAIPENDQWWGTGFTEWRNVSRGIPRFSGHHQPRIPRDLGFYDLSDPAMLGRQVELARQAGIHGFCFYYYWFNGRRLLERPVDQFLADTSIDFPFCVAWANENWTRRWDGFESEVLLRQEYDPAHDESLVDDLQRHFDDPRYIRIQGRPLVIVYRVDVIPDAKAAVQRWRRLFESRHSERPLILVVQAFGTEDPRNHALDGAVELPPHKIAQDMEKINGSLRMLDPRFEGRVLSYDAVVGASLDAEDPDYPLVKTAVPAWDNDARRQGSGMVLQGSSPDRYERWLAALVEKAERNPFFGESLVFVNAWNEWAEAAYLEPDVHYGGAYLNATARAVCMDRPAAGEEQPAAPGAAPKKVLLVGHDAHPNGAQLNLRSKGQVLRHQFGCELSFLLRQGGPVAPDYEQLGEVYVTNDDPQATQERLKDLRAQGFELAIANTAATGSVVPYLKDAGFRVVSLVHELPGLIREFGLEQAAGEIAERSDKVVFAADAVRDGFCEIAPLADEKVVIRPQGLYQEIQPAPDARSMVRVELGIPEDARIALNVGYADFRKGVDIFLHAAKLAAREIPDLHFVWVGNLNKEAAVWLQADLRGELGAKVHFVPFTDDIASYYGAADVFFLSSREDPYPAVVLEAMQAGLPVVAFEGSGGIEELAAEHGALVDRNDIPAVVRALDRCSSSDDVDGALARRRVIEERFQYDDYCFGLLEHLDPALRKVSVIVPNFNYEGYLDQRLASIFDQTYPLLEVIVLDDCSQDQSLATLDRIQMETGRRIHVVTNERNSGSAFHQWIKACDLARGDYIWIAEADDLCRPRFLERMAAQLQGNDVAFAFSDSAQIDERGRALGESYKFYYREAVADLMDHSFVLPGESFVRQCLVERNLILNVSSVVWNRECLREALDGCLDELLSYKLAGDWHLYAAAALSGRKVAYVAEPLNVHRRHETSVTGSLDKQQHLDEVRRVHSEVAQWLDADASVRGRMTAYEGELAEAFGLGGR